MKNGTPYLRVYAQACRGLSYIVAGEFDAAIKDLVDALGFARRQRAGLESEARILADLANAYRLNGEDSSAVSAATEAIEVATLRHARVARCLAHIVRAEAIFASPSAGEDTEARLDLDRVDTLLQETGVLILAPLLQAARAKLSGPAEEFRQFCQ